MKTLAFLIDTIDNSKELIRFAALLGKDINAKVQILYTQYPHVYGAHGYMDAAVVPDPLELEKIADEITIKVDEIIKGLKANVAGLTSIEFKSEIGAATAILKEKVENNSYDMVMLQGNAEQSFWLQDSVIMDIVRNVPCPVWIVPPDAEYQPMNKIIYATDHNEEDIPTLISLIALAKPFDPEILALHISNDDEFEKKLKGEGFAAMLGEKTAYSKISVKMIADKDGKDAVESLVEEAEKAQAKLIVVLKENKNFFERLFKSSYTAKLVKETQLPILVFQMAK